MMMATPRCVVARIKKRGDALRQDVPEHQTHVGGAEPARCLDERHFLERQRDGADDPAAKGNARDGDGHDDGAGAGAERHGDGHGEHEIREGLHEFDGALADDVEAPPKKPAG